VFKISGAVLLIGASFFTGVRLRYLLNERKRILTGLLYFIQGIENKLRCLCMPLDKCFGESGGIFYSASVYIKEGFSPSEAVKKAAEETVHLKKEDKALLLSFADGLSADDLEGQIANLNLLKKGLEARLFEAEEDSRVRGKLCVQGCTLLGAAAVILML